MSQPCGRSRIGALHRTASRIFSAGHGLARTPMGRLRSRGVRRLVSCGTGESEPPVVKACLSGKFAGVPDAVAPPPGFYEDASRRRRWWDGNAWTEHVQPRGAAEVEESRSELTEAQRRAVLERAADAYVQEGYRLESLSSWQAVVARRQRVRVW